MAGKAEQPMQGRLNPDNAKERSVASSILPSNDTDKTGVVGTELRKKLDTPPGTITMSPRRTSGGELELSESENSYFNNGGTALRKSFGQLGRPGAGM